MRKNGTGFRTCSESLLASNANPVGSASPPDLLQAMLGEQQRQQVCGAMGHSKPRGPHRGKPWQQHQKL